MHIQGPGLPSRLQATPAHLDALDDLIWRIRGKRRLGRKHRAAAAAATCLAAAAAARRTQLGQRL